MCTFQPKVACYQVNNAGEEVKFTTTLFKRKLKDGSGTTGCLKSNGFYEGGVLNCMEDNLSQS